MPSVIEEIWIFTRDGIPIAEFGSKKNFKQEMVGGFLSAIKTYCQEVSGSELKSFSMGDFKFMCVSALKNSIIICCKSAMSVKEKNIQKMIKVITKMFNEMFSVEELENWNGDISLFDDFSKKLDLYFRMGDL